MPEICSYKMVVYRTGVEMGYDPMYRKASEDPLWFTGLPSEVKYNAYKRLHEKIDRFLIADFEAARKDEDLPGDQYDGFVIAACVFDSGYPNRPPHQPQIEVIADVHDTPLTDEDTYEVLKAEQLERHGER